MANPKIIFTDKEWATIEAAAKIHCTGEEIAAMMGVNYETLDRRIKEEKQMLTVEYLKKHASTGKASLRRMQWKSAEAGSVPMLIWLGKQNLGQTDKQETQLTGADGGPVQHSITVNFVEPDAG